MRQFLFCVTTLAAVTLVVCAARAQRPDGGNRPQAVPGKSGFDFGGVTEFDSPPLGKNDRETRALTVLDEMSKGRWYLNVTTTISRSSCRWSGPAA